MAERHKFPPTHGLYNLHRAEYRAWQDMKQRCLNASNPSFPHYGGRGIEVCDRWKSSFAVFLEDIGPRPAGCSIDRINNDLGYSPENCRWATKTTQSRNTRRSTAADSGVYFDATAQAWVAQITVERRAIRLGSFKSKDLAVAARKDAERSYWKDGREPPPKGSPAKNNTSGFVGVSKMRETNRWQAYYGSRNTRVHIGLFGSPQEAVKARQDWLAAHGIKETP